MKRNESIELLLELLERPKLAESLSLKDWDAILRLARRSLLLARIARQLQEQGSFASLPDKIVDHLVAAERFADHRRRMAAWELNRLERALASVDAPVVALKGGAYILAGLPVARGRLLSDVDIMVPRPAIGEVERVLRAAGWKSSELGDYDERYYREWMHEVPPLRHPERACEVDLHHAILPPTGRMRPDPDLLFAAARPVEGSRFKALAPCDMALHSAAHLFVDSDLSSKLRDLVDLDELFRHFSGEDAAFWKGLTLRAQILGLARPLHYALRYCKKLLNTPIPAEVLVEAGKFGPPSPVSRLMDVLVPCALLPEHPDHPRRGASFARFLLYIRSHWLRMPLRMLIPHLLRKSVAGIFA
jgi:hypothetical protein